MSGLADIWWSRNARAISLLPVSWLLQPLVALRRLAYRHGLLRQRRSPLPVIVVGNISVGGTGKTPFTRVLVQELQRLGWRPGIVSRGYGGAAQTKPVLVQADSTPELVGDEPVLHARDTGVPVCVCVHRPQAVARLAALGSVDIVISDDGLQHYAMERCVEVAVVDAARGFGNGWLLPAGPLREPLSRLNSVDLIAVQISSGGKASQLELPADAAPRRCAFSLELSSVVCLAEDVASSLADWQGTAVHAMAGLGDPERFFQALERAGLQVTRHPKPDHHAYLWSDLEFADDAPILVTSKDAVKLRALLASLGTREAEACARRVYEVPVEVVLDDAGRSAIKQLQQHCQ